MNEAQTLYRNYQKITLQESPGSVPAGRIPRSRDVILVDDLCDTVRPGEQIKVTGIYKNTFDACMNVQQGFPVFATVIEANSFLKEKDFYSTFQITDEDKAEILRMSRKPNIEKIVLNSIAPSIYGYEYIKRAIAYALFGGIEKKSANKHRVRGDINVLILGDPGCGKSQFLKYVEHVAFRSVYATGKGASAVGLTASVRRDPLSREWTLQGGALVLADRGICLIDEFDKMNEKDRTSIHEAMEQQSISISKAGIVASLHARCSVIAAANPVRGRYDGSFTFVENVDLTDPLLSRFDVLAVVRDRVDPIRDEQLAEFVVSNHIACHPENMDEFEPEAEAEAKEGEKDQSFSQTMLRKYILYAKQNCHPKLDNIDRDKIANFYAELRQQSMQGGGIPVAVRHIESMLRLTEARARLHLRTYANANDVDMAIRVILESFIDTQKQSVQSTLRRHFKNYLSFQKDSTQLLLHLLQKEVKEEMNWRQLHMNGIFGDDEHGLNVREDVEIDVRHFEECASQMQITDLHVFYGSQKFRDQGFEIDSKRNII